MTHEPDTDHDHDDVSTDVISVSIKDYEADKARIAIHHQSSFGKLIEVDGSFFIDCRQTKDSTVKNHLIGILNETAGSGVATNMRGGMFSVDLLAKYMEVMEKNAVDSHSIDLGTDKRFAPFWASVRKQHQAIIDAYEKRIAEGVIEFTDLDLFFRKNDKVVDLSGEFNIGGVVVATAYVKGFGVNHFTIRMNTVHAYSGYPKLSTIEAHIQAFGGLIPLSELSTVKLTDDLQKSLSERGAVFRSVTQAASYMRYQGDISRAGWWGARSAFRAEGRVMIDPTSFARIDHDGHERENRLFSGRGFGLFAEKEKAFDLTDADLWRTYPYVLGFSFRAKQWGRMDVMGLTPIAWRDDAFDYLVMDGDKKRMVRALVDHAAGSFSDIVDEKGGGTIFMLAGKPGLGKTLLAETVAEISHKPLYSVSVGELGTEPTELEERLRMILDVATIWDAVLLIDEADIFLEARDTKDIVRNAMVGVFLRLLEYHQGVLFLTTNRVKNIDPAFFSRISIPLNFEGADTAKREKIWTNLIHAAKIDGDISPSAIAELAARDVNGRQVKNAIRIGMTLARSESRKVTVDDLLGPIALADEFQKHLND